MKKRLGIFGAVVLVLVILFVLGMGRNGSNPHHFVLFNQSYVKTVESVHRLDEDGFLYVCDVSEDYYNFLPRMVPRVVGLVRETGCTGFIVKSDGDYLLCRNFDFPHLDRDGNITGCSVVLYCHPEGGYRSIAMADGALMLELGVQYVAGSLDDGRTDTSLLLTLPWLCMDGVNEAGLAVSIMSIDPKPGEEPIDQSVDGRQRVIVPELLRYILDGCASVDEAIELAGSKNVVNTVGNMYHLFVNDRDGNSVVIEWRNNEMVVVDSDAVTNFYLGSDDAQDTYYGDYLKEAWLGPADTVREYHYGYGHGYERFKMVVSELDGRDELSFEGARDLLFSTTQTYSGEHTSDSRYSILNFP